MKIWKSLGLIIVMIFIFVAVTGCQDIQEGPVTDRGDSNFLKTDTVQSSALKHVGTWKLIKVFSEAFWGRMSGASVLNTRYVFEKEGGTERLSLDIKELGLVLEEPGIDPTAVVEGDTLELTLTDPSEIRRDNWYSWSKLDNYWLWYLNAKVTFKKH